MRALFPGALLLIIVSGASCTSQGDAGGDAGTGDAHVRDPNANCVKPGTKNNELGVGAYCEPGTTDCERDGEFVVCSGAFGAPENAWFCTRPCTTDADCGSGQYCEQHDPRGVACVPLVCAPPDAGVSDAGLSDTGADH